MQVEFIHSENTSISDFHSVFKSKVVKKVNDPNTLYIAEYMAEFIDAYYDRFIPKCNVLGSLDMFDAFVYLEKVKYEYSSGVVTVAGSY